MRISVGIAVAVAALCCGMFTSQTQAQSVYAKHLRDGYGFGVGNSYGFSVGQGGGFRIPGGSVFGGGFVVSNPREDVPYFAKYPPVYYNGIIARPYGVSPYAAPPGIVPVEMMQMPAAEPIIITNPHVVPPASVPSDVPAQTPPAGDGSSPSKPLIEDRPAGDSTSNVAPVSTGTRSMAQFRRPGQRIVNPFSSRLTQALSSDLNSK